MMVHVAVLQDEFQSMLKNKKYIQTDSVAEAMSVAERWGQAERDAVWETVTDGTYQIRAERGMVILTFQSDLSTHCPHFVDKKSADDAMGAVSLPPLFYLRFTDAATGYYKPYHYFRATDWEAAKRKAMKILYTYHKARLHFREKMSNWDYHTVDVPKPFFDDLHENYKIPHVLTRYCKDFPHRRVYIVSDLAIPYKADAELKELPTGWQYHARY